MELLKCWLREAVSLFSMRNKGEIQVDMFKVLGERQVIISLLVTVNFPTVVSASLSINIASVSANGVDLSPIPSVGLSVCVCRSVCLPVCPESVLWQNG